MLKAADMHSAIFFFEVKIVGLSEPIFQISSLSLSCWWGNCIYWQVYSVSLQNCGTAYWPTWRWRLKFCLRGVGKNVRVLCLWTIWHLLSPIDILLLSLSLEPRYGNWPVSVWCGCCPLAWVSGLLAPFWWKCPVSTSKRTGLSSCNLTIISNE